MQQRISSTESLSSELFGNGLRLARNRGLADPGEQVAERRAAFARELDTLVQRLHRSRALALSDLSEATPGSPAHPASAGPGDGPEPAPPAAAPEAATPDAAPGDQP